MNRLCRVGNYAVVLTPPSVDIMAFIKDNPPPTTIILISGDRDFAYLLSTIRWRKYNVVLITNSFMTHESLTAPASFVYDWQSDVLKTRPPSKLPFPTETSSRDFFFYCAPHHFSRAGYLLHIRCSCR